MMLSPVCASKLPVGSSANKSLGSTTKALAALMLARLVDQGRLAYDQPVADVWPEFAQAGKAAITVEQALSQFRTADFDEVLDVVPGVKATFLPAGHILGAAQLHIEVAGTNLHFTGDAHAVTAAHNACSAMR